MQLRKLWSDWQAVPQMPLDAPPDLNSCLLHQEMQVVNCCIARKKRRKAAKESLDSLLKQANINNSERFSNGKSPDSEMCARDSTGDYALRLGADRASENLTLLETGEPIYAPTLQVRCRVAFPLFYSTSFHYFWTWHNLSSGRPHHDSRAYKRNRGACITNREVWQSFLFTTVISECH
jgi:hypothetical protein